MQESTHFLTVRELAESLASGEMTSVQLTQMYLDRAEELDDQDQEQNAPHDEIEYVHDGLHDGLSLSGVLV